MNKNKTIKNGKKIFHPNEIKQKKLKTMKFTLFK